MALSALQLQFGTSGNLVVGRLEYHNPPTSVSRRVMLRSVCSVLFSSVGFRDQNHFCDCCSHRSANSIRSTFQHQTVPWPGLFGQRINYSARLAFCAIFIGRVLKIPSICFRCAELMAGCTALAVHGIVLACEPCCQNQAMDFFDKYYFQAKSFACCDDPHKQFSSEH